MFASFDPVALDKACADAVIAATPAAGSILAERIAECPHGSHDADATDCFTLVHPSVNWRAMFEHAEKIGLGQTEYELIEI
jgi:uncharacterized Fe-S center protein